MKEKFITILCLNKELFRFIIELFWLVFYALFSIVSIGYLLFSAWMLYATTFDSASTQALLFLLLLGMFFAFALLDIAAEMLSSYWQSLRGTVSVISGVYRCFHA